MAAISSILALERGNPVLIAVGLILAASFLFLRDGYEDILAPERWIPYAWIALCLAPDHRFTLRSTFDNSISSASPDNLVQVAIYMVVGALVLRSRGLLVTTHPRNLRKGPLLIWPVLALGSTTWSLIPLFSFIRAMQLFVALGLALLTVRIWLVTPEAGRVIWKRTLRLLVQAVTILILIGFATGFWRQPRFAWPGVHPGVAAMYVGVTLLILVAGGRSFLGLGRSGYALRIGLFVIILYLGDTRGVLAGVLAAFAVMLVLTARTKPLNGYLGMTYYVAAVGLLLLAARSDVMAYVLRGGTTAEIASLNGRIPLWSDSIQLLGDADRWLFGFGYGSPRVLLPQLAAWAGTAHSSWVEILLAIGVLGPLLLAADVLFVLWHASSRAAIVPSALTVSILTLLLVTSTTGEGLVLPSLAFVMMAMLHVPVLTVRNSDGGHLPGGGTTLQETVASRIGGPPSRRAVRAS